MLSVKEAQERVLERISVLDPFELSITDSHGCVLAETVTASEDLPAFASSGIDGFAIRAEDTAQAETSPTSLTIIGEAASGRPFAGRVTHGEAVRVFAGAALPEGSDAIARRDEVAVVGSSMAIGKAIRAGSNVRPAGEDIARGDPVMEQGQRIRGMDVGVLAAVGRSRVLVHPRPRVVTFSAGDELKEPGQPLAAGDVRDSNSFAIAGMSREAGSEPTRVGVVRSDPTVLREKFQSYLAQADAFIGSGELSEDGTGHLESVVRDLGEVELWRLATQPETHLLVGKVQGRPFFGLPSHATSVVLVLELLVRPALLKMAGRQTLHRPVVDAVLEDPVDRVTGRECYLWVRAWRDESGWRARLTGRRGTSAVSSVAAANALAVTGTAGAEARDPSVSPERVRLILLEPLEGW